MGIRQTLNEKSGLTTAITGAILVIAVIFIAMQIIHRRHKLSPPGNSFFSTDDGKTWFVDTVDHIPPFSHDGKTAYRVDVYKCGSRAFVSHLERYTGEAQEKMRQTSSDHPMAPLGLILTVGASGREIKRPGDDKWVAFSDKAAFTNIMQPVCPDGGRPVGVPATAENATEK